MVLHTQQEGTSTIPTIPHADQKKPAKIIWHKHIPARKICFKQKNIGRKIKIKVFL